MGIEILLLLGVAIFVLARLFSVLGKQKGAPPPAYRSGPDTERPQPVLVHSDTDQDEQQEEAEASGLQKISQADPSFSQREFLTGAKAAYEMIVNAFAQGDRNTLSSLLTSGVFEDYVAAIETRENSGETALTFERLKNASLEGGNLTGSIAEVHVLFEAELSNEERVVTTHELWTFERDAQNKDPNWRLADVSEA